MALTVTQLDQLTPKNTLEEHKLVYTATEKLVASFVSAQKSALNRVRESKPPAAKTKKDKKAKKEKKVQRSESESDE
jgi:hypothetical protein